MSPDTEHKIAQVQATLLARYPDYFTKPQGERVLLAMSCLALDIKVREKGGNNHGPWVDAILDSVHLVPGFAWCSASIAFCSYVARTTGIPHFARVRDWVDWARRNGKLLKGPKRGCIVAYLNKDLTGHVGACAGSLAGFTRSYEGNTQSGSTGDQREGSGLFPRTRLTSTWKFFIDID